MSTFSLPAEPGQNAGVVHRTAVVKPIEVYQGSVSLESTVGI